MKKIIIVSSTLVILAVLSVGIILRINWNNKFNAPGSSGSSDKQVEDYFVEKLGMSPEEAKTGTNNGITFRVSKDTTIDSIINNLTYYGLAKDKETLKYALEKTKDNTPGKDGAIKIEDGSIDISASYTLSKNMTAWEIADTLLNKPKYWDFAEPYSYIFMPTNP
jgi:hypothetical protein